MSTTYAGKPGNDSAAAALTVSTTTGNLVSPIVVTTTTPHGLQEGERVWVYEVRGNTAANGIWYASVTGASTFALYSGWTAGAVSGASTGNGAFVAGGGQIAQPLGFTNITTIPADGVDGMTAASVNVPMQGQMDRAFFLAEKVGMYRLNSELRFGLAQTPGVTSSNGSSSSGAWGRDAFGTNFDGQYIQVENNDLIELTCTGTVQTSGTNVMIALRPSFELADYGVAFTGTTTPFSSYAGQTIGAQVTSASQPYFPVTLHATTVVSTVHGKKFRPGVDNYGIGGANTYVWVGDIGFVVRTYRRQY